MDLHTEMALNLMGLKSRRNSQLPSSECGIGDREKKSKNLLHKMIQFLFGSIKDRVPRDLMTRDENTIMS